MKLSGKIGLGYGLVIVSLFSALLYQGSVIYKMQSVNRRLSQVSFQAAHLATSLRQTLNPIEEFTQKFSVTGDLGYLEQMEELGQVFVQDLDRIRSLTLDPEEANQVNQLSRLWAGYRAAVLQPQEDPANNSAWLRVQLVSLRGLQEQTNRLAQAIQEGIRRQVGEATRAGELAERVSLGVAVATLLGSLMISSLTVRSVSRRLRQVTHGTQALARGDFSYRLPVGSRDEFAQLAGDFNSMASRLSELDQLKKDFVSHVSHELKTPLGSMQETMQLLLEEIPGGLTVEQRRLIELNLQSSQRLGATIGNLLDMTRIEAGVMEYYPEPCDLVAVARAAMAELEPQFGEKELTVSLESGQEPISVFCDRNSIHRVITNLLENALKFSPVGGSILVRIVSRTGVPGELPRDLRSDLALLPARYAQLSVADSGPGVSDRDKQRIFESFRQVRQGKNLQRQGVGLGLAICQSIIRGHRGAIWVEDHPGGGGLFKIILPCFERDSTKGSPN